MSSDHPGSGRPESGGPEGNLPRFGTVGWPFGRRRTLAIGGAVAVLVAGAALFGSDLGGLTPAPNAAAPHAPRSFRYGGFAPYIDTLLPSAYDLVDSARKTGVRQYTLAFVTSGGGCTPRWGGSVGLNANPVAGQIEALRRSGGDVRVSFGGNAGRELGQACSSAGRLASAYEKVINAYRLKKVDFDIEGSALGDGSANDRRARAIAVLQRRFKGLDISFTLPVLPSGLTRRGVNLITNAAKNGVRISAVNVMAMDYGAGPAPAPTGRMGDYAISAATAAHGQLGRLLGIGDAAAWNKVALTPMIGVNDVTTEVFTLDDARKVAAFARSRDLAWLSMWSATRDKPCPGGTSKSAHPTCSGVHQPLFGFTRAFT
jgi:hypothetical protein